MRMNACLIHNKYMQKHTVRTMPNTQLNAPSNHAPILAAKHISKTYQDGNISTTVLHDLSLDIYAGEQIAIVGTSGSGKSTLLHILGGLDIPTSGKVLLHGQNIAGLNEARRAKLRNTHLGFIYQFHHLLEEFSATENVAMPLLMRNNISTKSAKDEANLLLEKVGLAHRLHHKPSQLSGGERQRVAIARALITKPSLVLADEPTGNLDEENAQLVFSLLSHMQAQYQTALLMVTHDKALASCVPKVLTMRSGQWGA